MNYLNAFLADAARAEFARDLDVRRAKWSRHNLARMLNASGMPRVAIACARGILADLGLGTGYWIVAYGVFDHGEMWARAGLPSILVGHPYGINEDERDLLNKLGRLGGFRVSIDDRPSYYGHGTNHVRVELGRPDYASMTEKELGIIRLDDYDLAH